MFKVAFSPVYRYKVPDGHRFPMDKYDVLAGQLVHEGTCSEGDFFHPQRLAEDDCLRTHTAEYWSKMTELRLSKKEERAIGFEVTAAFVDRARVISRGTIDCAILAKKDGVALNAAGGTHHAFADRGEGFCCFNDQAVAANWLIFNELAQKILIVDLDVHQGNGTASIFENEPRVFTFSMHGERNYPHRKEKSDLDIGLADGCDDRFYLKILKNTLPRLIDEQQPDFVFFQSGVDVLETDRLGRLALTREGCRERDRFVFETCRKNGLPVAVSMGGGYSPRLADIVEAHANTFRMAAEVFF